MLAKLRTSLIQPSPVLMRSTQAMFSAQRYAALTQMQQFEFGNLQQRINRRLRKYRQEKITKESSFNKNEGKVLSHGFIPYSFECFLLEEDDSHPRHHRDSGSCRLDTQF